MGESSIAPPSLAHYCQSVRRHRGHRDQEERPLLGETSTPLPSHTKKITLSFPASLWQLKRPTPLEVLGGSGETSKPAQRERDRVQVWCHPHPRRPSAGTGPGPNWRSFMQQQWLARGKSARTAEQSRVVLHCALSGSLIGRWTGSAGRMGVL